MRRIVWIAAVLALLAGAGPARAASPSSPRGNPPPKALADRDHDRISDDFQPRLAAAKEEDRFPVVVTFSERGDAASARRAVGDFEVRREFTLIDGFAATMTAKQIRQLSHENDVYRIEREFAVHAMLDAARHDFGADAARAQFGLSGSGVGICVVDTGADKAHEQLDDAGKIVDWLDLVNGQPAPYDDQGHGTHVLSIATGTGTGIEPDASKYRGVAPAASAYVVKALDADGVGQDAVLVDAISHCADQPGVDVISLSIGTVEASDGNDSLSQAVNAAVATKGKTVVVAAGNSGDDRQTVGAPGAAANAITVGAASSYSMPDSPNYAEGLVLAYFSSRGPTLDGRAKPDVVAPGVNVIAALAGIPDYYIGYSGTSMATPFVAGLVALAEERTGHALTPSQAKSLLESTAKDWGAPGKDYEWGSGVVDGLAFVAQAGGDTTSALSYPTHQYVTGSVGNNGSWTHQFTVTDLSVPIAATVIINGQRKCIRTYFGCAYQWSPDLDVEIRDPNGQQIALSECANGFECNLGRQETPHAMPTIVGMYTLRVYPFSGSPNNGKGGSFAVDLAFGPVVAAPPPPPPPPPPTTGVHVGDLDATASSAKNSWATTVTIRIHTGAEAPQAGAVVTAHWIGGTSVQCTTDASGACSVSRSGISKRQSSITLTVDNVSASGATYDPAANHDPDGDSNGSAITVTKP